MTTYIIAAYLVAIIALAALTSYALLRLKNAKAALAEQKQAGSQSI